MIALGEVEADNTSENVVNEIKRIPYWLYQEKEVTKKVYENTMNSVVIKKNG